MERTAEQNKEEEKRYFQEEKDKMSVEMYEQWLVSSQSSLLFLYVVICLQEISILTKSPIPCPYRHRRTYNKREDKKKREYKKYFKRAHRPPGAPPIKLYLMENNFYNPEKEFGLFYRGFCFK